MSSLAQVRAQAGAEARAAIKARQQARIDELMKRVNANNNVVVTDEHGNVVRRFRTDAEAQNWMAEQNRLEHHARVYKKKRKTRVVRKRRSRKSSRKTRVARKRRSRKPSRKTRVARKRRSRKSKSVRRKRKSHRRK